MALDVRGNSSGRPLKALGGIVLVLVTAGILVWVLRSQRVIPLGPGSAGGTPAPTTPADARETAKAVSSATAPGGGPGGRARGRGESGQTPSNNAFALPVSRVDADKTLDARVVSPDGDGAAASRGARNDAPEPPIYDASDASVKAPKLITPLAYAPLSAGTRVEAADGAVRIVVNENGTVDSVKATVSPKTIGETLLMTQGLSIAKAWRFDPAIKDGHAVKYSLVVPLSRMFRNSP